MSETFSVINGDCLIEMAKLAADSFDSIASDPPYGLKFMGKAWDHGVPGSPFWIEALRVAKPGAYLAAFGGTRTFHRLAVAIEDAGWEIRDAISWLYGSGWPKSLDVGEGRGTALKPAWEPIILARKPIQRNGRSEPRSAWHRQFRKAPGGSNAKGYTADVARGQDRNRPVANNHPTVKPLDLMRWLCRLITPPKGMILDPFTGSGSTGCAALSEGFSFVGIELDPEYAALATKRIEHHGRQLTLGIL